MRKYANFREKITRKKNIFYILYLNHRDRKYARFFLEKSAIFSFFFFINVTWIIVTDPERGEDAEILTPEGEMNYTPKHFNKITETKNVIFPNVPLCIVDYIIIQYT